MVLFKRKAVFYLPAPAIEDEDEEVWFIPQTGEVFTTYDAYITRMDWYKQKRFTCEVSGRSGMSFFDALRSESAGSREVEQAFPDALKGPVLKRVQFSTTSRIDNLVDEVFDDFKADFYPGEIVTIMMDDAEGLTGRLNGRVREKAKFAEQRDREGNVVRKAFARYFVRLIDRPDEEALVDGDHMARDRKIFTKQMLRSFIKNCVTREAWNGAPWLVKSDIAERYHIDTNVPRHLQRSWKVAERKAARKFEQQQGKPSRQISSLHADQFLAAGMQPGYTPEQWHAMQQNGHHGGPPPNPGDPDWASQSWHHAHGVPYMYAGPPPPLPGAPPGYHGPNGYPMPSMPHAHMPKIEPPPPPPPPKYPLEDMEIAPKHDGAQRPALKFPTQTQCQSDSDTTGVIEGIDNITIGHLLEVWNTLNVHCQVLKLDSFTFDDFVEAMQFSSDEVDCELLSEMHCAVLKQLVNAENQQNGAIQISLPDLPDPSDSEDEEEQPETREPSPSPEPEIPARRTRSSLNKVQNAEPDPEPVDDEPERISRAAEMFDDYPWIQRLRKRDFREGGWELVLVGLLHQLAGRARLTEQCNKILSHLAPLDAEPIIDTVRLQYSTMDINLRVLALQIIASLFLETKTVKTFLEEMSNTMTEFRKVKIVHQRERKDAIAKLKNLDIERKLAAPTPELSPSPEEEPVEETEDGMEIDKMDDGTESIPDSEDDEIQVRSLRRGQDRAAERKRKREEEADRKAREAEAKQNKGTKEYQKILKQIDKERERLDEADQAIAIIDEDLRQADCTRTRVLGKDRFCNRYWWFERNAMPHAGLPESSTADANYANGRVWVQGPDDMERIGFIDVSPEEQNNYKISFQVTPVERKALEEGPTQLQTAHHWGFYEDPEDVAKLIDWLDIRGVRELKLRKELIAQQGAITRYMENRKEYLTPTEESVEEDEQPPRRMATRKKIYISEPVARCTHWENTMAWDELGHKHIDPPPVKKGRRQAGSGGSAIVVAAVSGRKTRTRAGSEAAQPRSRNGRAVGRPSRFD